MRDFYSVLCVDHAFSVEKLVIYNDNAVLLEVKCWQNCLFPPNKVCCKTGWPSSCAIGSDDLLVGSAVLLVQICLVLALCCP